MLGAAGPEPRVTDSLTKKGARILLHDMPFVQLVRKWPQYERAGRCHAEHQMLRGIH